MGLAADPSFHYCGLQLYQVAVITSEVDSLTYVRSCNGLRSLASGNRRQLSHASTSFHTTPAQNDVLSTCNSSSPKIETLNFSDSFTDTSQTTRCYKIGNYSTILLSVFEYRVLKKVNVRRFITYIFFVRRRKYFVFTQITVHVTQKWMNKLR